MTLSPQASQVLSYMSKVGSISAQDAFLHMSQMTSSTLSRRICDIREAGVTVWSEQRINPATQRKYTRYYVAKS